MRAKTSDDFEGLEEEPQFLGVLLDLLFVYDLFTIFPISISHVSAIVNDTPAEKGDTSTDFADRDTKAWV